MNQFQIELVVYKILSPLLEFNSEALKLVLSLFPSILRL